MDTQQPALTGSGVSLASIPQVKEKKKRNRQRLSCTECTKRRQKCDRQRPCGLCTTRGVTHLCRWESDYARPPPAEGSNTDTPHLLGTIDHLRARIAALENTLQRSDPAPQPSIFHHHAPASLPSPAPSASVSTAGSPNYASLLSEAMPSSSQALPPIQDLRSVGQLPGLPSPPGSTNDSIYAAAVKLAQTSLASAAGEYIGQASVVCTMYKMSEGEIKYPYVQSTALYSRQPPHAQSLAINSLLQRLPPRNECDPIMIAFFAQHNWRFGVPETIFRQNYESMWQLTAVHDNVQVNPHWLGLLFSALAFTTSNSSLAAEYFYNAVTARRIAEDMLLSPAFTPAGERKVAAAADGAALSCFAAVLQATYLADRGMVSEGWKLVGNALRNAIAIGMHRDPSWITWTEMNEEEQLLRRRAWWSLVIFDRLHSYILGRPTSISPDQFDVRAPDWTKHGHCSYGMYEEALVKLSDVVYESHHSCLGIPSPSPQTVAEVDEKFNQWESNLHIPFRWRLNATPDDLRSWGAHMHNPVPFENVPKGVELDPSAASNEFTILRQRHSLATWFLACRIMLHRQFVIPYNRKGGMCIRNTLEDVHGAHREYSQESENRCFELCLELCTVQVAGHGVDSGLGMSPGGSEQNLSSRKVLHGKISGFMDSFFLFDCSVSLMLCLCSFRHGDSRARLAYDAVERAGSILGRLARTTGNDPQGDISRRAIAVLLVLKRYQEQLMKGVGASLKQSEAPPPPIQNDIQLDPALQNPSLSSQMHKQPSRNTSSVSAPSSYERYSRYLDTTASPQVSSAVATGFPDDTGVIPDFSFLNSFSFPADPSAALREFASPTFDWGANWSTAPAVHTI